MALKVEGVEMREEVVNEIDTLIVNFENALANYNQAKIQLESAKAALAALAKFTAKTVRLRGESRRVKLQQADNIWDQGLLRMCLSSYPNLAAPVIKPASYKVMLREYQKIKNETGGEEFEIFKGLLNSANLGIIGSPRITVEN